MFVLWHRPHGKARWRAVTEAVDHAEAVARIDGPGDWLVSAAGKNPNGPSRAESREQPALFS